jgi:hypothetical protein
MLLTAPALLQVAGCVGAALPGQAAGLAAGRDRGPGARHHRRRRRLRVRSSMVILVFVTGRQLQVNSLQALWPCECGVTAGAATARPRRAHTITAVARNISNMNHTHNCTQLHPHFRVGRAGELLFTLAKAFPKGRYHGYDISQQSVDAANKRWVDPQPLWGYRDGHR